MAKGMSRETLIALAREGAQARIKALRAELASLESMFGGERRGRKPGRAAAPKRRRRKMSAAARKRISDAQKARWAKQKAGAKK